MSNLHDRREAGVDEIVGRYTVFISKRPALLFLLYDIEMMPEQCVTRVGAVRLGGLCEVWRRGEKGDLIAPDADGSALDAAVVLRRRVDELADKLAQEEDRRIDAENDRDRFIEGNVLLAKKMVEIAVERDCYQVALTEIAKLKPKPIGETGFRTGPALLLDHAQKIAREAIRGAKR